MQKLEEFTLGIEEEYQIVDPQTRELSGRAGQIIPTAAAKLGKDTVQPEIHRSQVEIATSVCFTLKEARTELGRCRGTVIEAAAKDGKAIAAAGTHPFSDWKQQAITPKKRYLGIEKVLQQAIRELVIFGCHVHVGLEDRNVAIGVVNRARNYLSILLALSANSPFWLGEETGYASYRTELWYQVPLAGPPAVFENLDQYQDLVQALTTIGAIADATKIYWDIRLSEKFPTVEFRIADVCMTMDETIMLAGLVRGLTRTCYLETIGNQPFTPVRYELLRAAHWQAARYGLQGNLIDVVKQRSVPASELVHSFLDYLRPALKEFGDWEEVSSLVEKTLVSGNGAARQSQVYQRQNSYKDVVDYVVAQTSEGIERGDR